MGRRRKKVEPDDKEQSAKFIETAQNIKDDNDKEKFKEAFNAILKKKLPLSSQNS